MLLVEPPDRLRRYEPVVFLPDIVGHSVRAVLSLKTEFDDCISNILRQPAFDLVWPARLVLQAVDSKTEVTVIPKVEGAPRDTEVPACRHDLLGYLLVMLEPPQT